jgi:signal transduction histidine kinase
MFPAIPYPQLRLFFDGMLCMMALYALFSYTQHRKAIYWQYALYIFCLIITFYWDDIDYGKADYLPGTNFKVAAVESLAFLLYIRFAILLIEIPRLDPLSHRILKIMVIILAIEITVDLVYYLTNATHLVKSNTYIFFRCLLSLGALVVVPRILKLREVAVGYFIAGSFFFVLGCLVSLASNFLPAMVERNTDRAFSFPLTYMEIGVILEVLCFTLGMSVKNRKNELEKILAQEQLIEQLLENDRKQSALLRIRDDISRDLHDELGADLGSISVMSYAAIKQLNGTAPPAEHTIKLIGETSRKVIARMR